MSCKENTSVAIIAFTHGHSEYYTRLVAYFKQHKIKFIILCPEALYNDFRKQGVSNCIQNKHPRFFRFFIKHINVIKQCDYIIFDEPYKYDHFLSLYVPLPAKKIITIHNVRQWFFFHKSSPLGRLKNLAVRFAKLLANPVAYITVNLNAQKLIMEKQTPSKVFFVPFGTKKKRTPTKDNSGMIKVLIPGMVSAKRRNYDLLLESVKLLKDSPNNPFFELILLGKPIGHEGETILAKLSKAAKDKHFQFLSFHDFIPQQEFENQLSHCDFILSNNYTCITDEYGFSETYGLSKESGVVSAAINYSKPLIVPAEQKIPDEYEACALRYQTPEDLQKILHQIINKQITKESFAENFRKAHERYSKITALNEETFISFIKPKQ